MFNCFNKINVKEWTHFKNTCLFLIYLFTSIRTGRKVWNETETKHFKEVKDLYRHNPQLLTRLYISRHV